MFSLINAKVIVSYFVAAAMIAVGGGSLVIRYIVMVAASIGLDMGVSQDTLTALPTLDVSWGLLMGGLAVFGYRRTQERHIAQSEELISQGRKAERDREEVAEDLEEGDTDRAESAAAAKSKKK